MQILLLLADVAAQMLASIMQMLLVAHAQPIMSWSL